MKKTIICKKDKEFMFKYKGGIISSLPQKRERATNTQDTDPSLLKKEGKDSLDDLESRKLYEVVGETEDRLVLRPIGGAMKPVFIIDDAIKYLSKKAGVKTKVAFNFLECAHVFIAKKSEDELDFEKLDYDNFYYEMALYVSKEIGIIYESVQGMIECLNYYQIMIGALDPETWILKEYDIV